MEVLEIVLYFSFQVWIKFAESSCFKCLNRSFGHLEIALSVLFISAEITPGDLESWTARR